MYKYYGTIIGVTDGDTVDVSIDLGFGISVVQRVRLYGIDTPEIFKPKNEEERQQGLIAKDHVSKFIGKEVEIQTMKDKKEKYGRYLADIHVIGEPTSLVWQLKKLGLIKK